jgi:hypothetical protein
VSTRYPLRALGVVPRLRRNAKERVRGTFKSAKPVTVRRSFRAPMSRADIENGAAALIYRMRHRGGLLDRVTIERAEPNSDMVTAQLTGRAFA